MKQTGKYFSKVLSRNRSVTAYLRNSTVIPVDMYARKILQSYFEYAFIFYTTYVHALFCYYC